MRFRLSHLTRYHYASPAAESFMEARLSPVNDGRQRVISRRLLTEPACSVQSYTDYFGNLVEHFSILQRHESLTLHSEAEVETSPTVAPPPALQVSVSEARQIYRSERLQLGDFALPSPAIAFSPRVHQLANQFFRSTHTLGTALDALMQWIATDLRYVAGSTQVDTPVDTVLTQRTGVCQDFAQVMIAVLRSADVPARYVTGYIETESDREAAEHGEPALVGASESHAWVEVYLPGSVWYPLDPTNHCVAGERHVKVAVGRDHLDTSPTRGVFKGTRTERLEVAVQLRRIAAAPRAIAPSAS
jgi:transglutaminase-like putative cysteine protease